MVDKAKEIWRDGPLSNPNEPSKPEIRAWGSWIESIIDAFFSTGGKIYQTRALLNADLSPSANAIAWVMEDPTVANNGIYRKVGVSGTGSWTRAGDLPFSFISASNPGAGTANAIVVTTSVPVSGSALVLLPIAATNTASPVTVSFNGGSALTVKTNSGNDVAVGGLVSGMIALGIVSGATFRLVSDQASAVLVASAEASAAAALAYRNAAQAAAAGVTLPSAVPSTYLRQKPDNTGFQTRTAAQVALDLNQSPVQIFGDSSSRTAEARFGDTFDIKEFGFNVSGAVGTETANNAALDRLIAHATANPGMIYCARKGDVIRWSAAGKTFPKSRLRFEGARMQWVGDSSGSAVSVLTAANGTDIDAIAFEVPIGGNFRRFMDFMGDNKLSEASLECESQIHNEAGSLVDKALRFRGHRNRIGPVKVKNVDNCVIVYGEGGAGAPQIGSVYEDFIFENYAKGGVGRNLTRCSILHSKASGKSGTGLPNPGYNAWEWEGLVECYVGPRELFDADEHNERWGGPHSGEQLTRDCIVGDLLSGRAGQCAFKCWSGFNTDTIRGMTFGNIHFFDAGLYAQMGNTAPPQFNDFGVMAQNLASSTFGRILGYTKSAAYSSLDGVYLSQINDVEVQLVAVQNAYRNILRISEYNGNNSDGNDTNGLGIRRVRGSGHLSEGIYIQVPNQSFRDIHIDDFQIVGGTDVVRWEGAITRAAQPNYFRGAGRGFSGAKFNVPGGVNIKTVDKFA